MNKAQTIDAVRAILAQIHIDARDRYTLQGKTCHVALQTPYMKWDRPMDQFGENSASEAKLLQRMKEELSGQLYAGFYATGDPHGKPAHALPQVPEAEKTAFMDALSRANQTREAWDPWWTVLSSDPANGTFGQKNGVIRSLMPNEWQPASPTPAQLVPGALVNLLVRKEKRDIQPVFYYAFGQELMAQPTELIRFYFHFRPEAAAAWVGEISAALNQYRVPFLFKCLNHPAYYTRTDCAVLYLEKPAFGIAARLLRPAMQRLRDTLNAPVPLFTRQVFPGIGFAEDPGGGKSFGMYWSDLLAGALVHAFEKGASAPDQRLASVLHALEAEGANLDQPYIRPHSRYPYPFSSFSLSPLSHHDR